MQAVSKKMAEEKNQFILLAKGCATSQSSALHSHEGTSGRTGDTQNAPKPTQEQSAIPLSLIQ